MKIKLNKKIGGQGKPRQQQLLETRITTNTRNKILETRKMNQGGVAG